MLNRDIDIDIGNNWVREKERGKGKRKKDLSWWYTQLIIGVIKIFFWKWSLEASTPHQAPAISYVHNYKCLI